MKIVPIPTVPSIGRRSLSLTRNLCRHSARSDASPFARPRCRFSGLPALGDNGARRFALFGEQHLLAALRRGKGVILWASPFTYSHLVFKMALKQAGHPITQLSRPTHGFGPSPLAIRLLNPIWMHVEERFLRERVLIDGVETEPAIKRLKSRLAENGIVVITVGNEARHTVEVPFLKHRLRVATGPAFIAQSSGATLVPAFAVRGTDGTYEVTLESPLPVPPRDAGPERLIEVAAALARRIEPHARRFPEQWSGWNELIPVRTSSTEEALGASVANRHFQRLP